MIKLGATGEYPYGKLNCEDEGEIKIAIGGNPDTETVVIDFGTSVCWIGMRPEQAELLAAALLTQAERVKRR